MSGLFEALSAPARRAILDALQERNGQALYEICARLGMQYGQFLTRQAVSQHLAVLEDAGLIRVERVGRYKFHYLEHGPLREISERWPAEEQQEES